MTKMPDLETLLALRQARKSIAFEPLPTNRDDMARAYALSLALAEAEGGNVAAWKLGGSTAATRAAFETSEVYFGPVLHSEILDRPTALDIVLSPLRGEAEIALRLKRDLPPRDARDAAAEDDLFDIFAPVIECPWSVVENLPHARLPALLMDRCAAGLLLVGEATPADPGSMDGLLRIVTDGTPVAEGRASVSLVMSPMAAAVEAIRLLGSMDVALKAGQWISTGGITPCIDLSSAAGIELFYDGVRQFSIVRKTVSANG